MESPEHTQLEIDLTRSARAGLRLIRDNEVLSDKLRDQRKEYTTEIEVLFAKHVRMRAIRHYVGINAS